MRTAALVAVLQCQLLLFCVELRAQDSHTVASVLDALSYVPARSSPTQPDNTADARPSVFATQQQRASAPDAISPDKPNCVFGQMYNLTGQWVKSSTPSFHGYYNATADCPDYAHDFDCQNPNLWGVNISISPTFIQGEYSQVFQPDSCNLRTVDKGEFGGQMKGRRLIFLGDSLMRGNWQSLACWLRSEISDGHSSGWDPSRVALAPGNYTVTWGDGTINVTKQYVGEFTFNSGGKVYVRDHSFYNQSLFDDIMAGFQPITSQDILVISYGGWYSRFDWDSKQVGWNAFQDHMTHLFQERLATWPGQVIWKEYTPQHFGGPFGFQYGIGGIVGGEFQYECQPATVGEFWYDQFIRGLITNICKDPCKNIRIMPVYEMTRQRPNSHGGSFGRGVDTGDADCKHYCNNVIDWWNVVLYNMLF